MGKKNESLVPAVDRSLAALSDEIADVGIKPASADMFDGMTIEHVVSLQDGDSISGVFLGEGESVLAKNDKVIERIDPETGEVTKVTETTETPLKTWRIEVQPGKVACVVSSAQLDTRMPGVPLGDFVTVARLGTGRTRRGQQITRYLIGHKPVDGDSDAPSAA